jgi:hypothetical protein
MSDVAAKDEVVAVTGLKTAGRTGQPARFPARLARSLMPGRTAQRGLVTVEFIFGIILVIAMITVVVSVIHNPSIGRLLVEVVSWLLGLIKGVKA